MVFCYCSPSGLRHFSTLSLINSSSQKPICIPGCVNVLLMPVHVAVLVFTTLNGKITCFCLYSHHWAGNSWRQGSFLYPLSTQCSWSSTLGVRVYECSQAPGKDPHSPVSTLHPSTSQSLHDDCSPRWPVSDHLTKRYNTKASWFGIMWLSVNSASIFTSLALRILQI